MTQRPPGLDRRRALLLLGGAAAPLLGPLAARAQDAPPPPVLPPTGPTGPGIPAIAPEPPPPAPLPPLPSLLPAPAPAVQPARPSITVTNPSVPMPAPPQPGAQPSASIVLPNAAIDRTKMYVVFFDQVIDANSMKALRRQLTVLAEAGVEHILLCIHSAGGLIDPMLATYAFIRALPARIDTHATSFVMSAATTLFLAGETRSADRTARFMFHPSQAPVLGSFSGAQMQDRLNQFDTVDGVSRQIYHDRTSLTDADMDRFNHGEVYYTAEQARAVGIVQQVQDLRIPGPDQARIVFVD